MGKILYKKPLHIRQDVDVFVAGAGPAGVAAAVTAAREGAKVFMVEATSCAGGMGTSGLVPAFMQFGDDDNFYAGGFGREILDKAIKQGGVVTPPTGRVYTINPEGLKRVYDDLLLKSDADFVFQTRLVDVKAKDRHINYVVCAAKSGMFSVRAKIYIDATGDGDLAALAGVPYKKGDENGNMMPSTPCALWSGINWDKVKRPDSRNLEEAFDDNIFTVEDRHMTGMFTCGDNIGGSNVGHNYNTDGTDENSMTKTLVEGRKLLTEFHTYYKNYLEGYEDIRLLMSGALPGIRESRRIKGRYCLNIDDFKNRAVFHDEIGRFSYPVDIHPVNADKKEYEKFKKEFKTMRYKSGESYGIPYRSLVAYKKDNLLTAGRCIGTDRYMQSSIRVMPCCYITGQAAGVAAAMASDKNLKTKEVDIPTLRKKLKNKGAFLPDSN